MVYNEQLDVDGKVIDVAEILPGREGAIIRVRVVRMWKTAGFLNPSETNSIEMVLIDAKGGKIHASVRKHLIQMFESKIDEGQVYEISNFSVVTQGGLYRTTLHPYKIAFQSRTQLTSCEGCDLPELGLSLMNVAEICAHTRDYEYLVDVVGVMTGISAEREYIRDDKITKMVIIELTDHTGKCECALFGDYVDEVKKKLEKSVAGLPIVVVQYAKIKIFRDKVSIQNVMNTTRVLINPDIPEVEAFKNSIAVHGIETDASIQIIGEARKPSLEEEFLRMHPKKTIDELMNSCDGGVYVVCAEVVRIVDGHDWWYPACKCHKSVVPDGGSYFCTSCDRHVFHVIPRFRVKLEVTDHKSTCVFVVFDSDMSYVLEKSCSFFVAQSKSKDSGSYPIEFESLIGHKMLFAVDLSSKGGSSFGGSFRVKRICMESKVIKSFCAECPLVVPAKGVSGCVDVDSDVDSISNDSASEVQAIEFANDVIVTPPISSVKAEDERETPSMVASKDVDEDDAPFIVKRNLGKSFDKVAGGKAKGRLKKMKVEKE